MNILKQMIGARLLRLERVIAKQGPPGPPPRPGLVWNPNSHRWVRPQNSPDQLGPGGMMPGVGGQGSPQMGSATPTSQNLMDEMYDTFRGVEELVREAEDLGHYQGAVGSQLQEMDPMLGQMAGELERLHDAMEGGEDPSKIGRMAGPAAVRLQRKADQLRQNYRFVNDDKARTRIQTAQQLADYGRQVAEHHR